MSEKSVIHQYSVIDLFAGVGGLSLGATRAGFDLLGAVETDKSAVRAHKINFPKVEHVEKDVARLDGNTLLTNVGRDDIQLSGIIGGPPCQGFSHIGYRNPDDERNSLFFHFFRLVNDLQPTFFLAENVPGILDSSHEKIREAAFEQVSNYNLIEPLILKASDYGSATLRCRVFFIGYRSSSELEISAKDFDPPPNIERVKVEKALYGLPKKLRDSWNVFSNSWRKISRFPNGSFGGKIRGQVPGGVGDSEAIRLLNEEQKVSGFLSTIHTSPVIERFKRLKQGEKDQISRCVRLKSNGFCPTIRSGTGPERGSYQAVRPIHPTEPRVITPREAARLQGFPDWFQFDETKWHSFRQIGNSVSPILAEFILTKIREAIESSEESI